MKTLKTTLLLALTSIIMTGCATNSTPSEYGREASKRKLYGDVKILEESRFTILKKYDAKKHVFSGPKIFTYNKHKDLVEVKSYDRDGSLSGTQTYIYDKNGYEIESKWEHVPKASDSISYVPSSMTKSIYDADNKNIEQYHYDIETDTIISGRSTLEYDQNNNLIKDTHYSDSVIDGLQIYKYDEQNRIIEDAAYANEKKSFLYQKFTYKYYDNKRDVTTFNPRGELRTITYTYDDNNNIIEMYINYTPKEIPDLTYKYKYDKYHNIIDYIKYNEEGEITETETNYYKYDKHNNWIEKIEYQNKIPKYITIREITYY